MVQIVQLKTKDYSKSFDKLEQIVSPIKGEINLVDLAGSEKVGKTGATGDRLGEG